MSIKTIFPSVEIALELEPEDLAPFVLKYLSEQRNINRYNFTLGSNPELIEYAGGRIEEFSKRLMEAWMWLEKQIFVAPQPGQQNDWAYITKRGQKVLQEENFDSYKKGDNFPWDRIDPVLIRKVKSDFLKGDFDTAIFKAFKEVEVRVRKKAKLTDSEIGVPLMTRSFSPNKGPLADQSADKGEQVAMMNLFAGAIGKFKNPSSHRDTEYTNTDEVKDILCLANQLLRIIDNLEIKV